MKESSKMFRIMIWVISIIFIVVFVYLFADKNFQIDSENLAVDPIYAIAEGAEIETENYGLGRLTFDDHPDDFIYNNVRIDGDFFEDTYTYTPYRSQIGLQGIIYQVIAKVLLKYLSLRAIYNGFRLCCILLFVIVICMIVWQLKVKYGFIFASIFGIVTFLSTWTQNFAGNLYWVEFTWFIPLLLGLLVLNYPQKRAVIYLLFYISVLIKCMCGYEYLSTVLMAGVMFLLVEYVVNENERKKIRKTILIIGLLSIAAFLTVYVIHAYLYGSGNILEGLRMMQTNLVGKRTYGNSQNYDSAYADSLNASVIAVLNKYIGFGDVHGVYMFLLLIAAIITMLYRKYNMRKNCMQEICMFVVALLSTLSWMILAKGHSYIHTHMNFVLFYLGWVQISVYIIVNTLIEKSRFEVKRKKS